MKYITNTIIMALLGLLAFTAHADDVDIYLKTNQTKASPPYLMFFVDYRPNVIANKGLGCGTVAECYYQMSTKAFIQLCIGRGIKKSMPVTLSMAEKISLCTRYVNDMADDGYANYSTF